MWLESRIDRIYNESTPKPTPVKRLSVSLASLASKTLHSVSTIARAMLFGDTSGHNGYTTK